MCGRIIEKRNAGADPDIEDAAADALGCRDRRLAARIEHCAEDEVIDRRPARIRLCHRVDVDLARHGPPLTSTYISACSRMMRSEMRYHRLASLHRMTREDRCTARKRPAPWIVTGLAFRPGPQRTPRERHARQELSSPRPRSG
jgi:hypothetical protein